MSEPIIDFHAYHIGGSRHRPHWASRWHVDRWFRSWQCEWDIGAAHHIHICRTACRAWTKAGAIRKAKRWHRNGTDVAKARKKRMS